MTGYNHFADFFPCAGMPGRIQQRERTGAPRGNDWSQSPLLVSTLRQAVQAKVSDNFI
jgi:hypothetical protein